MKAVIGLVLLVGLVGAASSAARSDVEVGTTIDGGTQSPDQRAEFFVGSAGPFTAEGATSGAPYYLLRGSRWTRRVAFRAAPGVVRVVDTRDAWVRDYPVPQACVPRDVTSSQVLLGCPTGVDPRLLGLRTGAVTRVPGFAGRQRGDFWPLALGRYWILGETCADPLLYSSATCRYVYIRRRDGSGRLSNRILDIDARSLPRLAPATTRVPFVASDFADTTRTVVLSGGHKERIRCSGSCLQAQLVGRWLTWRDDAGIGIVNTATRDRRRIMPSPGTQFVDVQQRPGRRIIVVQLLADGDYHVHVMRF